MDANLRWQVQLEGIRTRLLYDGVMTILNGLELLKLLIFEALFKKFYLAPSVGEMWLDLRKQLESNKEKNNECQNK
jgi:hypothetical protein